MDFTNKNLGVLFEIAGVKFYITQTLLATWVVMAVLIVFALVVRVKLKNFKEVPTGFQNVVETLVEVMDNYTINTMGKEFREFGGHFFSIFAFILLSNYSGLFGLRPPTSDLSTTIILAGSTFLLVHITGIIRQKGNYIKSFFQPNPIFFPINLISEVSDILSLTFRLFGNILGGVIIVGLVYSMIPYILSFILPTALHLYFDIFSGALQAFIFTVLSMTMISQKGTPN